MRVEIVKIFDHSIVDKIGDKEPADDLAPVIPIELIEKFKEDLLIYKYELLGEKNGVSEYRYTESKSWSLKVLISNTKISFTAPLTRSYNSSLVFESLQTASELSDHGKFAVYYPRDKEWIKLDG